MLSFIGSASASNRGLSTVSTCARRSAGTGMSSNQSDASMYRRTYAVIRFCAFRNAFVSASDTPIRSRSAISSAALFSRHARTFATKSARATTTPPLTSASSAASTASAYAA
ncbi:hypothetical protein SCE1572_26240 [Sorangium cellulosum So0157-2]|uniref:Uncharacterized protein n=1 Tax=Sorangium cellulosum So0157-2 TaxID=1254432 RepID=S4Y427_SORCE|nr:hypothetical protein SCE1572_26240 [Sorangium cellulosum So0157-2]